jgi:AGZA family xanthine/uracil permease-like MFS transporter
MARFSGVVDPSTGDFPRSTLAYCTDAMSITIGSLFGCSPVTAFIESGAGITEGGRTGLTAITTGVCFLISIFFAPIFAGIPPWATGCTLVLVGCMMMRQVTAVNWSFIGDALPAFVTIVTMPFAYSVAYGLIAGLVTYTVLNSMIWITKLASSGRIVPPDADAKDYWTYKSGGNYPPWFIRVTHKAMWFRGKGTDECKEGSDGGMASESEKEMVEGASRVGSSDERKENGAESVIEIVSH